MAKGSAYGNLTRPSGEKHLTQFESANSALARFLYPLEWRDKVFVFDDFTGPDLSTHFWTAAGTNGTVFDPPATQVTNGIIQGVTGPAAGEETTIRGDAVWLGDQECGMEIRWSVDDITSIQFEVGFTDPLSSFAASAVNSIDTPSTTNGSTDVALVAMDTSATLTTMAFITDGSGAFVATKTNLGTRTPTNSTYITTRVQLGAGGLVSAGVALNNGARCFVLDTNDAIQESAFHGAGTTVGIEGGTLVLPWFYMEPLAAARTVNIDYIAVWQDRR